MKVLERYNFPAGVGIVEIVQDTKHEGTEGPHGEFYGKNSNYLGTIGRFSRTAEEARKNSFAEIKNDLERQKESALARVKLISPLIEDLGFVGNGTESYKIHEAKTEAGE